MMEQHPFDRFFATYAALQRWTPRRVQHGLSRLVAAALLSRHAAQLQCRFETLLGETSAAARALVYDWFFYKQLERESWVRTDGCRDSGVLLDVRRVGDYLNTSTRGVVIATMHMGDYLEGLRQLRLACSVERKVFVIRRREWSGAEQIIFDRIGAGTSLTVLRRGNAPTAIRELRRGAIVIVLFDLPARYGRTTAVDFFDRRANVVRGPAELSVLGNADVLPLFCHYDAEGIAIAQAMPVIAVPVATGADRAARVVTVAQRLWKFAEAQIRRHPSQWAHWSLVDELFEVSGGDVVLTSRAEQR
jgi:lauroyl/myristoyl acyltransferase